MGTPLGHRAPRHDDADADDDDADVDCFQFGDRGKLCLVRFVNSSVTVRVGGGWKTLEEFFDSSDPCRCKQSPVTAVCQSMLSL